MIIIELGCGSILVWTQLKDGGGVFWAWKYWLVPNLHLKHNNFGPVTLRYTPISSRYMFLWHGILQVSFQARCPAFFSWGRMIVYSDVALIE